MVRESMVASWYNTIPTIPASTHHWPPPPSVLANHFLPRIEASEESSCSLTMAARTMGTALAMTSLVVVLGFSMVAAQGNGCSSVMMTLSPCMDFISSKAPIPGISCCSVLAGVVQTDPRCLCMVLDGTAVNFGISINQTRALELPGICKVQAPPISQCTAVPTAPAPTPSSKSAATEEEAADAAADGPSGKVISKL
ncbi:unnamed protein product [Urochloa humidicola]